MRHTARLFASRSHTSCTKCGTSPSFAAQCPLLAEARQPARTWPVQPAGKQRRLPRRPGFSAMTRPHPRHAPPLMPAQSAFANSRRTPMDRRRLSCGRAVAMHCTWVVWPIWLLMSGSCAVLHAGRHGRPQPPRPSRALAAHTVSPLRNRPQITTLPRASTTKPLHPDPQPTSCRSVARGSFWRTRRMLPRMLLGKSYLTGTCTGRPSTHGKLAAGRPSGFACAAIPASMNTTRCCKACRPTCPTHGPRRLAIDLREFSRGWVCCRGSPPEVLPCPGQRLPLPDTPHATPADPPAPAGSSAGPTDAAAASAPNDAAWYHQGPPRGLNNGRTHSWLFVPSLHAAVGRLHPAAVAAWQAHAVYAPLWQRALDALRQAPPVQPAALVHALHTLQQLATEEGRALPVPEAQLLLTVAAETNALPSNSLVHLLWAWHLVTPPDGYIPATVQEALLHVFMGEQAASALLRDVTALHRDGLPAAGDAAPPPQVPVCHPAAARGEPLAEPAAPPRGRLTTLPLPALPRVRAALALPADLSAPCLLTPALSCRTEPVQPAPSKPRLRTPPPPRHSRTSICQGWNCRVLAYTMHSLPWTATMLQTL